MQREQMLELWNDMANEGNWVPSWTDSLAGLTPESASWTPGRGCHSVWQEVVHVIFWRKATLRMMDGESGPSAGEVAKGEFAQPDPPNAEAWTATVDALKETHERIAAAIQDPNADVSRVPYHLIHDAYHLGRITQLRAMQGVAPTF
jgi:hypothetical protein